MTRINSVLGDLDTVDMGFTLMHEHLLVAFHGAITESPELLVDNAKEQIFQRLREAKTGGIDTIVDMTTIDLGRNIMLMEEAARVTGVNIVACSGWWLDVPRFLNGITANQLADMFIREIKVGIKGTGIKSGILKAASDFEGITPLQEINLRAVARAHLETGVPIAVHSYHPGQIARSQIAILKEEGVDLSRVKFDHANDSVDIEYLTWILEQGCYLGLDRYPGRLVSPLSRTRTLKSLIDAGYIGKLCPSHDCMLAYVLPETSTPQQIESNNPHRFLYLKKVVFPWLVEMGLSEEARNSICIDGPRNYFSGDLH